MTHPAPKAPVAQFGAFSPFNRVSCITVWTPHLPSLREATLRYKLGGILTEPYRVLKSDGQLLMFEHVRSKIGPFGIFLDLMTPLSRRLGPDLNRDTVGNVQKAGFRLRREENVYLDIVKIIEAVKE